jgi:hypothetical protein
MTKMYIEKTIHNGCGLVYIGSSAAAINQSDKRRRTSDKVPDGEVRVRAIRIREIIVALT